jgi:hypothetical protein
MQLLAQVEVMLHAKETKVATLIGDAEHSKTRKIIRHDPAVLRILRFRSEGPVLDWKLDHVGPKKARRK